MDVHRSKSLPEGALPRDAALPALSLFDDGADIGRLRTLGIRGTVVARVPLGYHPGRRCTLRLVTDEAAYIVKVFARRAERVHTVLTALADADFAAVRVPRVLGFDPDVQVLVTDEFPPATLEDLVAQGQGARAGTLAAAWITATQSADLQLGRPIDPLDSIAKHGRRADSFHDGDLADRLRRVLSLLAPRLSTAAEGRVLLHGSFKLEHLHDCGDAVGPIDWDGYRQGPPEYDAATFLATAAGIASEHPEWAGAIAEARTAFLEGCGDGLDPSALRTFEILALAKVIGQAGQVPGAAPDRAASLVSQAEGLLEA